MSSGYEITFNDFRQLLSHPEYRSHVAPLIKTWFGCEVVPTENGFVLRDRGGFEMNPRTVHDAIQADQERQFSIYQTAMSLWR